MAKRGPKPGSKNKQHVVKMKPHQQDKFDELMTELLLNQRGATYDEIADVLGVTKMRVCQIMPEIVEKFHKELMKLGVTEKFFFRRFMTTNERSGRKSYVSVSKTNDLT